MESVLLRELLLRSFPNGENFNYQLICRIVSSELKFPIVSAYIKCMALTPLFWQWELSTSLAQRNVEHILGIFIEHFKWDIGAF